jgi:regulator of protease activity HflC (stomatin/prohibitin superfamily)
VTLVNWLILGVLALAALLLLAAAVRIIPEYQRLVVFRLGRVIGARGPGLVLLIPIVDRGVRVDLRERYFDIPPQTTITVDNAHVSIDLLIYNKIVDALPSVLNVADHQGAARGIAITTLRAIVGSMLLDDVLSKTGPRPDTTAPASTAPTSSRASTPARGHEARRVRPAPPAATTWPHETRPHA